MIIRRAGVQFDRWANVYGSSLRFRRFGRLVVIFDFEKFVSLFGEPPEMFA